MAKDKKQKNEKMPFIWSISIFISIILFLISLFSGINFFNKEPNNKIDNNKDENIIYNNNKDVINDKEIKDVTFTNIECTFDGFRSLLSYTIINNSKKSIILEDYELIIKDKNDNILAIMVPGDTSELKPKESIDIGNAIDIDLTKASKLELRLSK